MQKVNMPAFYLGVIEELQKEAFLKSAGMELHSMPVNENILPNLANQAKWKYVKTKAGLKLSDGNLVYSFGMPDKYPSEDAKVQRLEDDNILNFEKDMLRKGTAQIHRASPDNIYMTLADGAHNPTFMLQHEEGKNWRYSPSKKFLQKLKALDESSRGQQKPTQDANSFVHMDPESMLHGAKDHIKHAFELDLSNPYIGGGLLDLEGTKDLFKNVANGVQTLGRGYIDYHANNPASSIAGGYLLQKGFSKLMDKIHPGRVQERALFSPQEKTRHALSPITNSILPVLGSIAFKGLT